jgi:hypothetical protein
MEKDRRIGLAVAEPIIYEIRMGKPDRVVYVAVDNDEWCYEKLEEQIALDAVEAGVTVEIRRLTQRGSKFAFSSKKWGACSWEPEGPKPNWDRPRNDPKLS